MTLSGFKDRPIAPLVSYIALAVAFLFSMNGELENTSNVVLYYLPFAVAAVALVLEICSGKRAIPSYVIYRTLFLVFLIATVIYSVDAASSLVDVKRTTLQTIVLFLIAMRCRDDERAVGRIAGVFILAAFADLLYVVSVVDLELLAENVRLGVDTVGGQWNANSIGLTAGFAFLLSLYRLLFVAKRHRIVYVALLVYFGVFVVLSGSRKSVLLIPLAVLFYLLLASSKRTLTRNLIIVILLVGILLFLLFNVPYFYDHVGYRLDLFFGKYNGGATDHSTEERSLMVEVGMGLFRERPVVGYGAGTFRYFFAQTAGGRDTYSHNNVVELLVGGGLILLFVYYGYLVYRLIRSGDGSKRETFLRAFLLSACLLDFALVSYNSEIPQAAIALAIAGLSYPEKGETVEKSNTGEDIT